MNKFAWGVIGLASIIAIDYFFIWPLFMWTLALLFKLLVVIALHIVAISAIWKIAFAKKKNATYTSEERSFSGGVSN